VIFILGEMFLSMLLLCHCENHITYCGIPACDDWNLLDTCLMVVEGENLHVNETGLAKTVLLKK